VTPEGLVVQLEELRPHLPDPFRFDDELAEFFALPAAQVLVVDGAESARRLVDYVAASSDPALISIAVLLLSRLDPTWFLAPLLAVLGREPADVVPAFDAGFWRLQRPEAALATDVVALVESTGNPHPLLLLQRPSAANATRSRLLAWAAGAREPFARYARDALAYADANDQA
jgi:hypothetical protein